MKNFLESAATESPDTGPKKTEWSGMTVEKKQTVEGYVKATEGIKRRLKDWSRVDLSQLVSHIDQMSYCLEQTFNDAYKEMLAKCEEGTKAGRVWKDEETGEVRNRMSGNPAVASIGLIERLPWVISHDDGSLEIKAGDMVTVRELSQLAKEML